MATGLAPAQLQLPALDPDGDAMTFRLATPSEMGAVSTRIPSQPAGFN